MNLKKMKQGKTKQTQAYKTNQKQNPTNNLTQLPGQPLKRIG